jgi:sulfate-transporting ATPase
VIEYALLGLGTGAIYALLAQSVVLVHRGSGVLNFAAGAVGMVGAFVFYKLRLNAHVPWPIAIVAGLGASAAIGAATHLVVMRRLRNAAVVTKVMATLALATTLLGAGSLIFEPQGAVIAVPSLLPTKLLRPLSGLSVGEDTLILTGIALALTVALVAMQRYTRFGLATSAVAESRLVASSLGWSPEYIAACNWALGSALAAGAMILTAPLSGLDVTTLTLLIVPALAAALVGRFESFPLTFIGAMVIGIGISLVSRYVTASGWSTAIPLFIIVVALSARGRYLPTKSTLTEKLTSVGPGRLRWLGGIALLVGLILVMTASVTWLSAITTTLLSGLIVLSVVIVTGYAGQLSLAQVALAGMAAFFTAWFTVKFHIALWGAIPFAVLATIPVGLLVAAPALRTRGSNLAIATLSLAVAINDVLLQAPTYTTPLIGPEIGPLKLFGYDLSPVTNPRGCALLALVVLALATGAVANMRRGASGRRMLAVRGNERAAASLGISVPGVKLYAFGLAAVAAAIAGALTEAQLPVADFSSYDVLTSINSVLQAVVGGLGWASGATLGAAGANGGVATKVLSGFVTPGNWLLLLTGGLALLVILQTPDGLIPLNVRQLSRLAARIRLVRRRGAAAANVPTPVTTMTGRHDKGLGARGESARSPVTVEVRGVTVRFGGQRALEEVDLEIRPGEIVGLIGPNGAGKSTLVEVISGFQRATAGTVLLDGRSIDRLSPAGRARAGIGRTFQSLELFEDMTVVENVRAAAELCPPQRYLADLAWPRKRPIGPAGEAALARFGLESLLDRKPAELDHARRRLVAIARALAARPAVLLLDEPAAGLDEAESTELARLIRLVVEQWEIGVLVVEHNVDFVFGLCHRIVALSGRVIANGAPEEVRQDGALIAAYLGDADQDAVGSDPVQTMDA